MRPNLAILASTALAAVAISGAAAAESYLYRGRPEIVRARTVTPPTPPVPTAPLAVAMTDLEVAVGTAVEAAPTSSGGGSGGRTWTLSGPSVPAWLAVDPATGRLTGTAAKGSWTELVLTVSDGSGEASATFSVVSRIDAPFAMRRLGGTGGDQFLSSAMLPGGGVAIAGYSGSPGGAGGNDALIASHSATGELVRYRALGASGTEYVRGVAAVAGGGTVIVGDTDSPGGPGSHDILIASHSASGDLLWRRTLGGTGSDRARAVAPRAGGGVTVAGDTDSAGVAGGFDIFIAAHSASGQTLWRSILGGTNNEYPSDLVALPDGGTAVVGYSASSGGAGGVDAVVARYSNSGDLVWRRALGGTGEDQARAAAALPGGGVLVVGHTASAGGAGGHDAFVASYSSSGVLQWQRTIGGTGNDYATSVEKLPEGGVAVVGYTTSPGGAGSFDGFVATLPDGPFETGTYGEFTVSDGVLTASSPSMETGRTIAMETGRTVPMTDGAAGRLGQSSPQLVETVDF